MEHYHPNQLDYYEQLVEAGADDKLAKTIVKIMESYRAEDLNNFSTKRDIKDAVLEITNNLKPSIETVSFKVDLIYKASAVILVSVVIPLVLRILDYVIPKFLQ